MCIRDRQKPDNPQNDSNMDSILNDLSEEDKNSEIIQLKENNTKLLQENQQLKEKLNVYMKNSNNDLEVYYQLEPVSYTHLRAHETRHDLVCRLLLEKKKKKTAKH
eukprot:TRINITY_DN14549_c0_g1_i2.p4 TRINITY_DN14549_c0_g1~~TRINITY_DN14549_c0_g1_i2.p4  ORF type:complete len:106 (+),score=31.78 TRINITY_DN14549_c0_g1_i2:174-491(+)